MEREFSISQPALIQFVSFLGLVWIFFCTLLPNFFLSSQAVVNQLVPPSRAYNLEFYTDVQDLSYLQYHLDRDPCSAKYRKLTKELCEVIEDYGLVNFTNIGYSGISENVLAASNDGTSTEDGEQARRVVLMFLERLSHPYGLKKSAK
ncbi:GPN-loop GTPase 2-like isoform X1 [Amborella trichopoda]|uniref:GPN-loop GTPase 2-like isoform X1 n=1 Tax=Amborella trichopoda TaxID=13333 RepID=UPI0009BEF18E|nr:GPN-loop GTPase 2-like isoform X1 [Amborella trichopoda]|eukprot:XP_020529496.1 GPN-loop GTPase 2-like isoform X1 [Amborella trichopoda]